ncbi:BrnT family toxin [Aquicoccus sp. SCR17]|nr:BrnT family toxin [Carideicomes alvinocaridis]
MYEWDEAKRRGNLAKHGVDFSAAEAFIWQSAFVITDDRRDYGEPRLRVLGLIGARVHLLVLTPRGDRLRIISLRKANRRETRKWRDMND